VNRPQKKLKKFHLVLLFAVIIFVLLALTMLLMLCGIFALRRFGIVDFDTAGIPFLLFAVSSTLVGTALAMIFSRIPLAPLREIMAAFDRLAQGDFKARIDLRGPGEIRSLNRSFNHMAAELGGIELLRSDFVNNFSHEFKTPIVSVRGFAKILRDEELSGEERGEYLDIIISESERLAELATKVLNLSKVENQTIITDKSGFNGSEQLRRVIALLENSWAEKNIEIRFDYEDIRFFGNEELLNQVWTNLIDNAVKFSPENTAVDIHILKRPDAVAVTVSNQGAGIAPETAARIFDKFYQGDVSHAEKGNGIGLTIAKRIVELHGGAISVKSGDTGTTFIVELPDGPGART
jgi:signal transduction histidine kinase